ncbi:MAG TPA: hypothetical protein VEB22_05565 [Phycisphaerales bacterium]|nr:hypothetical protein [Phycisphaerales bacterium]
MKVAYELGSIFEVPLRSGGVGLAAVTRWQTRPRRGNKIVHMVGFDPDALTARNTPEQASILDTRHFLLCSDRALVEGRWKLIGTIHAFNPTNWPVAPAVRGQDRMVVTTNEETLEDENIDATAYILPEERRFFPYFSGLGDATFLEISLSKALCDRDPKYYLKVTSENVDLWRRVLRALTNKGIVTRAFF